MHAVMFKAPLMISCEEFEDFVLEYLDGGLTPRQRFVFELHLKICSECRAYLQEYQRAMTLVEAQKKIQQTDVPEDLIAAILDARDQ